MQFQLLDLFPIARSFLRRSPPHMCFPPILPLRTPWCNLPPQGRAIRKLSEEGFNGFHIVWTPWLVVTLEPGRVSLWGYSYVDISMLRLSICSQEGILIFLISWKVFGDLLCRDLTLLNFNLIHFLCFIRLLTQSNLPKNPLPTSFGLRYNDHLQNSAINSHSLSDPTTLKTPSGDYKTRNFAWDDFF